MLAFHSTWQLPIKLSKHRLVVFYCNFLSISDSILSKVIWTVYKCFYLEKINNDIIEENLNLLSNLEENKNFESIDEISHPFSLIVAKILELYPENLKAIVKILGMHFMI